MSSGSRLFISVSTIVCFLAVPEGCNKLLGDEARRPAVDAPAPAVRCLAGMVFVEAAAPFCMDVFEASRGEGDIATSVEGEVPWTRITYNNAKAACARAGKRLCKAAEFALACGGVSMRIYPYGNAYEVASCHGKAAGRRAPAVTGEFARCRSPEGVVDLLGNVQEWASECGQPATTFRCDDQDNCCVVFGGAFASLDETVTCALPTLDNLNFAASIYAEDYRGFRCCTEPRA